MKAANPALIGVFVLTALVVAVGGVIAFGTSSILTGKLTYVLFFDTSVNGLREGAPVTLRGVRVGQVSKVVLQVTPDIGSIRIPVYIEIEQGQIYSELADEGVERLSDPLMHTLVERGLRAELSTVSFVTGQQFISLGFRPDTPVKLVDVKTDVPQLPTVTSPIGELQTKVTDTLTTLSELPFETLVTRLIATLETTETAVRDLGRLSVRLESELGRLTDTADGLGQAATQTVTRAGTSLAVLDETLRAVTDATKTVDRRLEPLLTTLDRTARSAESTLGEASRTLGTVREMLDPGSRLRYNLDATVQEAASAARSIRELADYLARNPESLLTGKGR